MKPVFVVGAYPQLIQAVPVSQGLSEVVQAEQNVQYNV
jgi:hypothetical protein